jgi:hypothetical protein
MYAEIWLGSFKGGRYRRRWEDNIRMRFIERHVKTLIGLY